MGVGSGVSMRFVMVHDDVQINCQLLEYMDRNYDAVFEQDSRLLVHCHLDKVFLRRSDAFQMCMYLSAPNVS